MKKFIKYPVHAAEGAQFGIVMYVSGEKRGYLSSAAQGRGTFMLRISTNIDHAKSYTTSAGAKRAFAQYKYATEIAVYDNTSMPVEKWLMYIKEDKPEYDWYKWDSRVELKVESLQQSVTGSQTLDSIEEARSRKIPAHIIMSMHTAILNLLEKEYPHRDFELMVQPNHDEYRPAIVIVVESWIEYPDTRLTYKVYLDDPTVIYYGEDYTDEYEFGVNADLSEKIREIVEYYLEVTK